MGHRPDLNSLSAGSRATLRGLMLTYINDAVVWAHNPDNPNAIVHHMGEHAFITHRNYIGDLEQWLAIHGGSEFTPLPSWNSSNPTPPDFIFALSLHDAPDGRSFRRRSIASA